MRRLGAVFRVCRPHNALLAVGGAMLGVWLAARQAPSQVAITVDTLFALTLVVSSAVAAANVWNDICDVAADRLNAPQRPIAAGLLSARVAVVLAIVLTLIAFAAASVFSARASTLARVGVVAALIYSPWIKSTVLVGNVWVAVLSASTVILGALTTEGYSTRVGVAFALLMLIVLLREMMKSAADVVGDAASGMRSVATRFGPARAIGIARGVCVIFALVGLAAPALISGAAWPNTRHSSLWVYLAWWCIAVIIPLWLAFKAAHSATATPPGLQRALRLSKIAGASTLVAQALLP